MPHKTFEIPDFQQRLETYLGENRAEPEKDIFCFLKQMLQADGLSPKRFLDVGCATGDLLAYLSRHYPNAQLAGIDIDTKLIDAAKLRTELSKAQLLVGDGLNPDNPLAIFCRFEASCGRSPRCVGDGGSNGYH